MHRTHSAFALAALVLALALALGAFAVGGRSLVSLFHPQPLPPMRNAPVSAAAPRTLPARRVLVLPMARAPRSRAKRDGSLGALRFAVAATVISASGIVALAALLVKSRLDARETREYALYEVHLSMHDEASSRDVTDMVEALAATVREWPLARARHGQPFFALELHYGAGRSGHEFLIALRCEPGVVGALESIIASAYPDVRVGHTDAGAPAPIRARLREPGYVLRLRKERPFLYPLAPDTAAEGSPPLEAVAQTQAMAGIPSSVRLQFTPTPLWMEGWARRRLRLHERRLTQGLGGRAQDRPGSVLDQEEMRSAGAARASGLVWLEVQVAAATAAQANRIAAALAARRGENRLVRRRIVVRAELYRQRFPTAYPPLLPALGLGGYHSLATAGEVAHLLTLPSARMRAVPVRRLTIPRLPPPPEIARTEDIPVRVPGP